MITTTKDNKTYVDIKDLKEWDKNPRSITEKDFTILMKNIKELGQFRPLLVDDNGIVYGGNMRLKAFKALGISEVWISIIEGDDKKKLAYALSDNSRAGFYDDDSLANLTSEYLDFPWEDYSVDFGNPKSISDILGDLEGNTIEVEDKTKKAKLCPHCGLEI